MTASKSHAPIIIGGLTLVGVAFLAKKAAAKPTAPSNTPTTGTPPTEPAPTDTPTVSNGGAGDTPSRPSGATEPTAPDSPFVPGSCTETIAVDDMRRWAEETVWPVVQPMLDAWDIPRDEHDEGRARLFQLVGEAFLATVPAECRTANTEAVHRVRIALFCEIALALSIVGKIDEELEDILALCADPTFDPWEPRPDSRRPPQPVDPPLPPRPVDATRPPRSFDGSAVAWRRNVRVLSTKEELASVGVVQLVEAGMNNDAVPASTRRLVLLLTHPDWPGLPDARRALNHFAQANPHLTFVEGSLVDTNRYFGKPQDTTAVPWVLTSANPDGVPFPDPMARLAPEEDPPRLEEWRKIVAHASGGVGAPPTWAQPRRFGEILTRKLGAGRTPYAARSRRRSGG